MNSPISGTLQTTEEVDVMNKEDSVLETIGLPFPCKTQKFDYTQEDAKRGVFGKPAETLVLYPSVEESIENDVLDVDERRKL